MSKPETPLLDQLESGSWSSFVSGLKRLAASDDKPLMKDLLGQLEGSYETRRGYWKGGTVGVSGYGAGVDRRRLSRIGRVPHAAAHSAGGNALQYALLRSLCDIWEKHGSGLIARHGQCDIMLQGCRSENVQPCFDEANALGASSAPRLFDADRLKIATQRSCKRL